MMSHNLSRVCRRAAQWGQTEGETVVVHWPCPDAERRRPCVIQSNLNWDVAVKVFCRCGSFLEAVGFPGRGWPRITWTGFTNSAEGRKSKGSPGTEENAASRRERQFLPCLQPSACHPDFRLARPHNPVSQFLKVNLFTCTHDLTPSFDSVSLKNPKWSREKQRHRDQQR